MELGGKVRPARHAREQRARYPRGPATRGEQLEGGRRRDARRGRRQQALDLIDHVRGDIRDPIALDADVEVPFRSTKRRAIDRLLQVVDARDLDGGLARPAAVEAPENLALAHKLSSQD